MAIPAGNVQKSVNDSALAECWLALQRRTRKRQRAAEGAAVSSARKFTWQKVLFGRALGAGTECTVRSMVVDYSLSSTQTPV